MKRFLVISLFFSLFSVACSTENKDISANVHKTIQPLIDEGAIVGLVTLVGDKDNIITIDTFGYADIKTKQKMKNDTIFWIASQTKSMTASAIMILVDEGKINLDDPIEKFIPEFANIKVKEGDKLVPANSKPTVRQILAHTAGFDYFSTPDIPLVDARPIAESAKLYAKEPLKFQPNGKFSYSNVGYNIAGRIIEIVSGMPYEKFMQERLLNPLEMRETTFIPTEEQLKRLAKIYDWDDKTKKFSETELSFFTKPFNKPNRQPLPAGGYFSTAEDIYKFCKMLLNNGVYNGKRILSENAIKEMTIKQTPDNEKHPYGLGFIIMGDGKYMHGGACGTQMGVDANNGKIYVYLIQIGNKKHPKGGDRVFGKFIWAAY